jgi:hypothetical protein
LTHKTYYKMMGILDGQLPYGLNLLEIALSYYKILLNLSIIN